MWSVCVFLKKILNVFQKKKNTVLIPYLFFLRRFQKWRQTYKKASKSLARSFFYIYNVEKKKELGMETVEHTASTILVVQMVTMN